MKIVSFLRKWLSTYFARVKNIQNCFFPNQEQSLLQKKSLSAKPTIEGTAEKTDVFKQNEKLTKQQQKAALKQVFDTGQTMNNDNPLKTKVCLNTGQLCDVSTRSLERGTHIQGQPNIFRNSWISHAVASNWKKKTGKVRRWVTHVKGLTLNLPALHAI